MRHLKIWALISALISWLTVIAASLSSLLGALHWSVPLLALSLTAFYVHYLLVVRPFSGEAGDLREQVRLHAEKLAELEPTSRYENKVTVRTSAEMRESHWAWVKDEARLRGVPGALLNRPSVQAYDREKDRWTLSWEWS